MLKTKKQHLNLYCQALRVGNFKGDAGHVPLLATIARDSVSSESCMHPLTTYSTNFCPL